MSRVLPYMRRGHGTDARARRHYREGEKPCLACMEAMLQAQRLRAARRASIRKTDARAA